MIRMQPTFTTVTNMTHARIADVKFKPGMREQGLNIIADIGKDTREGFGGMLILLPTNDEDMQTEMYARAALIRPRRLHLDEDDLGIH